MNLTRYMEDNGHEELITYVERGSGLKVYVSIHDTSLGPALGPPRMAVFDSDEKAVTQALRFSQLQTLKYAVAGLPFGGGRAIILGDPKADKTESLVISLGRFVESLGGRFIITGGGVGFNDEDTALLRRTTRYILGLPSAMGGSGEPASFAAYGICHGMKACVAEVFGSDSLQGRTVAVQGLGKVGLALAENLRGNGAEIIATDVRAEALHAAEKLGAKLVEPDRIYDTKCDVFSPCAWGGILNSDTIPRLRCRIVAGSANDQLENKQEHAAKLRERNILYAPDYVINAGGMINMAAEASGYDHESALTRIRKIEQTLRDVFSLARSENMTTVEAAERLAHERLKQARLLWLQRSS